MSGATLIEGAKFDKLALGERKKKGSATEQSSPGRLHEETNGPRLRPN